MHEQTNVILPVHDPTRSMDFFAVGGRAPRAAQDHGFICRHGFENPDGPVRERVAYAANAS